MLVVQIVCWGAAIAAVIWATLRLIRYCNTVAYPYEPFTRGIFIGIVAAYGMMFGGMNWYSSAVRTGGDTLNGLALAAIGGVLLGAIVVRHVRRISFRVGMGISAVQLPIFAVLAYIGIFALIIGVALMVVLPAMMGAMSPTLVRIVD